MNPEGLDCCARAAVPVRTLPGFVEMEAFGPVCGWKECVGELACFLCCAPAVAGALGPEVPGIPNEGLLKGMPNCPMGGN